jgi:hypothetical protein
VNITRFSLAHFQLWLRFQCNVVFTYFLILYHALSSASTFPLLQINFYNNCSTMGVSVLYFFNRSNITRNRNFLRHF